MIFGSTFECSYYLIVVMKSVAFGEPKSILRNLPQVTVNGNARSGNWPGVFLIRCQQRLTVTALHTVALSVSRF